MSDVLIQSQNKSYVPRILEYYEKNVFCNVDARRPFPLFAQPEGGPNHSQLASSTSSSTSTTALLHDRLGTSAVELSRGWRGGRGPGLVLIKGVTASPEEFMDWVRWRSPLPRAVARIYWLGRASEEEDDEREEDEEKTGEERETSAEDDGTLATFTAPTSAELARRILSRLSAPPEKTTPVRVMAVPRSLQESLVDALSGAGWRLDVRVRAGAAAAESASTDGGSGGLFLVAAALDGLCENLKRGPHDPPLPSPRYRAALVRPAAVLSDTTAQREVGGRTCRAEWKLSEALAGLAEDLTAAAATRRAAAAIDVGASPGGWTRHLALSSKFSRVVALDPADLDADVAALPNVTHLRMLSRSPGALEAVRDALRCAGGGGDEAEGEEEGPPPLATLLTCDANEPPADAARCILPLVPLLSPGALVVLTLKMRYPGRDKAFATRAALEQLGPAGLELVEALPTWLMANTMYERTLVLRRKREKD